jgi:hypothetical protein
VYSAKLFFMNESKIMKEGTSGAIK